MVRPRVWGTWLWKACCDSLDSLASNLSVFIHETPNICLYLTNFIKFEWLQLFWGEIWQRHFIVKESRPVPHLLRNKFLQTMFFSKYSIYRFYWKKCLLFFHSFVFWVVNSLYMHGWKALMVCMLGDTCITMGASISLVCLCGWVVKASHSWS